MDYNAPNFVPCAKVTFSTAIFFEFFRYNDFISVNCKLWKKIFQLIDDVEENELNFFIKYGEIGQEGDVRDAYMKQKHRMIWERRHPEIMKAREEAYEVNTSTQRT